MDGGKWSSRRSSPTGSLRCSSGTPSSRSCLGRRICNCRWNGFRGSGICHSEKLCLEL
ncbi:hypothetical protein LINPERPRIM_LOCUS37970 [Linum perenne]